jgi:hypothetical protein
MKPRFRYVGHRIVEDNSTHVVMCRPFYVDQYKNLIPIGKAVPLIGRTFIDAGFYFCPYIPLAKLPK